LNDKQTTQINQSAKRMTDVATRNRVPLFADIGKLHDEFDAYFAFLL